MLPDGRAAKIEVVSGPGLGLDEAAVSSWRFKPALGADRKPVATRIAIELQFGCYKVSLSSKLKPQFPALSDMQ